MSRLTPAQQRFVEAYLQEKDPVAAACRAGYRPSGARRAAARNMTHAGVRAALEQAGVCLDEFRPVTQEMVVRELAAIGFATMADVCRWTGDSLELLDSGRLSPEQAAAIAEISESTTSRGGTVRVKLHSKLKALEMLARHVGLYDERTDPVADSAGSGGLSAALRERLDAMYGSGFVDSCAAGDDCTEHDPDGEEGSEDDRL